MNLEILLQRIEEISTAIVNATAQLNALHGHKAETMHWYEQLKKESNDCNENQIEQSVEPVVE